MTSSNGVRGAELGVKYWQPRAPWTKPLTWPSKLRLGTSAVSTRLAFSYKQVVPTQPTCHSSTC
eukprot:929618-Amphidinium_carterae.1